MVSRGGSSRPVDLAMNEEATCGQGEKKIAKSSQRPSGLAMWLVQIAREGSCGRLLMVADDLDGVWRLF